MDSNGKYYPTFAIYTGTETREERELVRNVFNGNWKFLPPSLASQLKNISPNNIKGEIIKIFMITSAGAEGISLKNVRHVHITEPYWHPVRTTQVIGRARRICSHQDLPKEERTVDVYLYLSVWDKEVSGNICQADAKANLTTDEMIFQISENKKTIINQLVQNVKEASIDCVVHKKSGDKTLQCFSFTQSNNEDKLAYIPSIMNDISDKEKTQNIVEKVVNIRKETVTGSKGNTVTFIVNVDTNEIYSGISYEDYISTGNFNSLVVIGKKVGKKYEINKTK
jgi:hypothetical protein